MDFEAVFGNFFNKIVEINPISAVSIAFTILYLLFTKYWMNRLSESHDKAIEHIKGAYSESVNALQEHIKTNISKKK